MKIAISGGFGGFDLPDEWLKLYNSRTPFKEESVYGIKRDNPILINLIESMPKEIREELKLRVVEIPDDVEWIILSEEGCETIHEKHRIWY